MFYSLQDQLDRMDRTHGTRGKDTEVVFLDDVWYTYGRYLYSQSSWRGHNAPTFGDVLKSLLLAGYTTCLWATSVFCYVVGWITRTLVRVATRLIRLLTSFTTKSTEEKKDGVSNNRNRSLLGLYHAIGVLAVVSWAAYKLYTSSQTSFARQHVPANSNLWNNLLRSKTVSLYNEVRKKATSCTLCSTDSLIHWTGWKNGRFTASCAKYCAVSKVESVLEVYWGPRVAQLFPYVEVAAQALLMYLGLRIFAYCCKAPLLRKFNTTKANKKSPYNEATAEQHEEFVPTAQYPSTAGDIYVDSDDASDECASTSTKWRESHVHDRHMDELEDGNADDDEELYFDTVEDNVVDEAFIEEECEDDQEFDDEGYIRLA